MDTGLTQPFSVKTLEKGLKVVKAGGVCPDVDHPTTIFWIKSAAGDKSYRVQTDFDPAEKTWTWITCTCPHGLNVGAGQTRCYHAAAVLTRLLTLDE